MFRLLVEYRAFRQQLQPKSQEISSLAVQRLDTLTATDFFRTIAMCAGQKLWRSGLRTLRDELRRTLRNLSRSRLQCKRAVYLRGGIYLTLCVKYSFTGVRGTAAGNLRSVHRKLPNSAAYSEPLLD